jgi:hypothetical protein
MHYDNHFQQLSIAVDETEPNKLLLPPKKKPTTFSKRSLRNPTERLTKLLQLMHLLLAGSLSSPRMIRSFLSSSFIRLAITVGSTHSEPLNTTTKGTKNHNQNTRNGPRSGEPRQIHPPRNTLTDRRALTCGRARLLGARARLGEHEIPRTRAYGGRGRGATTSEKARLFCCW